MPLPQENITFLLFNCFDSNSFLITHGLNVGLPEGQMGNSEVGHVNLGAGRIIYQDLAKINLSIKNDNLKDQIKIIDSINYAKKYNKNVHLIGLTSDGGVHSHINHLIELIKIYDEENIPNEKWVRCDNDDLIWF